LNRPQDVRRLLSRLIKQHLTDDISADTLRACTYAANVVLSSMEKGDLENRISKLEEMYEQSKNKA